MNIVFRVDAALHIGSGHVMRCLTLADELKRQGARCIFVCREFDGNLISLIQEKGFEVYFLPKIDSLPIPNTEQLVPHEHWLGVYYTHDAHETIAILKSLNINIDWLIIDHYAIDIRWEQLVKPYVKKIMLIDDLADRKHDCDLLLDQTFGRQDDDYQTLVESKCQCLLGSKFALLRDEFILVREKTLRYYDRSFFEDPVKRIFISMGGIDKDNSTGAILDSIYDVSLSSTDELHIVMGKNAVWLSDIEEKAKYLNCQVFIHCNVNNIAEIMAKCNLAIGAGGTTTWERSVLGIPSIVISTADNQATIAKHLAECGAHWYVGDFLSLNRLSLVSVINHAMVDKYSLQVLSKVNRSICDGKGTERVVNTVLASPFRFELATLSDIPLLYQWRNHPLVRASSFNCDPINYDDHVSWMTNKLKDDNTKILIVVNHADEKIGCVRLDINDEQAEISIYLSPEQTAHGYGRHILLQVPNWIKQYCNQVKCIKAQIKSNNYASRSIFMQSGYEKISSDYLLTL